MTVSSRDRVLAAIRARRPAAQPLPALDGLGAPTDDLVGRFAEVLGGVGGTCRRVADEQELDALVAECTPDGGEVCDATHAAAGGGDREHDPHAFRAVDLLVVRGAFGVAENAAVWVPRSALPASSVLFLAQHTLLVLRATDLVPDLHAAYARLGAEPLPEWGVFVSGPSKTADIEQCLVIGAHGTRSLVVAVLG